MREPVDERLHAARSDPVEDATSLAAGLHQACLLKGGEMLRDRRLGDVEAAVKELTAASPRVRLSKIARRLGSAKAWKSLSSITGVVCIEEV